jgi:hypothetical protein
MSSSAFGIEHGEVSKGVVQSAVRAKALAGAEFKQLHGAQSRAGRYAHARNEVTRVGQLRAASPELAARMVGRQKRVMRQAVEDTR